ncbi:MAG: hypothetical protein IJB20_12705 [Clostridia bacterium]|nr:hypothetical protein [Clostridia bacterium]
MRWNITRDGNAIEWLVTDLHTDDIEMAGFGCADVVKYGMTEEGFVLLHHPVYPTLRTRPNNTHASYQLDIPDSFMPRLVVNGEKAAETLTRVEIDGTLILECTAGDLAVTHVCYPSTKYRVTYEAVTVKNNGASPVKLTATTYGGEVDQKMGPMGINITEVFTDFADTVLESGAEYTYYITICGRVANEAPVNICPADEYRARIRNIERLITPMKLDTGNATLDTMFRFAKLRAGESVFDTMYGLMHSPGGFSYYAATWCNDQVEYAGPYFAYTGDDDLLEASMNAYRMYMPFMSNRYEPIPSSVIAEGVDYWNGAGDRGDAAMYLYGASRFALTTGRTDYAEELLPAIEWCAEYCKRKINEGGVVASDRDELEGRFPTGTANLCTSTLAYSGYLCAASLERSFCNEEKAAEYEAIAAGLRDSIETYFGANIHGMDTYKYYAECEVLRSWICMPLCVGIYDRAAETVKALSSEWLMMPEGMLTAEGCPTIWDRSTLYGLRGIFAAGDTEKGAELLMTYATNRLLGERVPYAVEAYPEGGKRHLSGESALFCKVITEGILDMTPTGLSTFTIKPSLPATLDHLYMTGIRAHGGIFDVYVEKDGYKVIRSDGKVLAEGALGECAAVKI